MTLSTMTAALDRAIDDALAQQRLVGCVLLLSVSGRVVHARAAGMADREAGLSMTAGTWLRYASVSKPFTTLAALRLMDQGRLCADDAVTRWLPDFTPALPDGSTPRISVDQLMSHLAGLDYGFSQPQDGPYAQAGVSDGIGETGITLPDNLRRLAGVPLDRAPGTHWRYSVATDVLGAVIEAAADRPLPEAMADLVTGPLGIEAGFSIPAPALLAANYASDSTPPRRMEGLTRVSNPLRSDQNYRFLPERMFAADAFPSGGAGMAGTAAAALAVLEALRAGNFISDGLREQARRNRIDHRHPLRGPGWGHAWAGAIITDARTAGIGLHKGCFNWGGIYGHSWIVDPSRDLSLVTLTNTTPEGMNGRLTVEITAALAS
jgi:CubicO group peptidase (beta-lactamase class C family)